MNKFKEIRPIVLGLAIKDNKLLVSEGFDNIKNQTFYRCLGGGIEFLEKSTDALKREFQEEINIDIVIKDFLGISEKHPDTVCVFLKRRAFPNSPLKKPCKSCIINQTKKNNFANPRQFDKENENAFDKRRMAFRKACQ